MCGRYTHRTRRSDEVQAKLADTLGVETPPSERGFERFNIAPTQEVLAVVDDRDGRRIEELRWGLVPHWATELNTRFSMINARAETLHEKPAYRGLVRHAEHRCLILADGYYEWQRPEDPRQPRRPVHFLLDGDEPFCFAGLWTRWRSPDGDVVASCTIVTCDANAMARPIHDRMPVILTDSRPGNAGSTLRSTARPPATCWCRSAPSGCSCARPTRSSTRRGTRAPTASPPWPHSGPGPG